MKATRRVFLGPLAAAALAVPSLCANDVVFVADSSDDAIYRLEDLDLNGSFNDLGEVTVYYDDATGSLPLTKPYGVVLGLNGTLYVAEAGSMSILALEDLNQDGDCLDAGEATVFFDGTPTGNPGGIHMTNPNGLTLDAQGRVWVASSNLYSSPNPLGDDMILVLEDLNADGNANGVGEATVFHTPALVSASVGDSIPTAVKVGLDGAIYYAENGVTGVVTKAVWRLEDLDASGTIDQLGEATAFFPIPTGSSNIFLWDVEQGADGAWYASDRGNEILWRAFDADSDGSIGTGEYAAWFTNPVSSDLWTVRVASDGSVYGGEAATPERIRRFSDDDLDGVIGAGEVTDLYDSSSATLVINYPRCIAVPPSGALASVTHRNGGTNWDVYTVPDPPVLGATITAEIDVATTGFTYTQLFGYEDPLTVTVGPAKTILVDITGGELLGLLYETGPNATYFINIPSLLVLEGYQLSTQAAVFNLTSPPIPWNLTNAQDWVLGN